MIDAYKYIVFRGTVITLEHSTVDNLWRAPDGTVMALRDTSASVDNVDTCGVGPLSLPDTHPLSALCGRHDYMYESPAFQLFHTREEADTYLEYLIHNYGKRWSWVSKPFYWLCRLFGGDFWENPKTR